jgi:hypothetical membrane protein
LLLLVGSVQWLLVSLVLMEGSTLGYNPSVFYVGDLGDENFVQHLDGPPAIIFNVSLLSLGILVVWGRPTSSDHMTGYSPSSW